MPTTPAGYVASLREQGTKRQLTRLEVEAALERAGVTEIDIDAAIAQSNVDYAERLIETLRPRLTDEIGTFLDSELIAVTAIEDDTINAFTRPVGSGHVIVIHDGTHKFIYRVARIISTRFAISGPTQPTMPFEETVRIIAEILWWHQETGVSAGPEYPIDHNQVYMANRITIEAMLFIMAHELAHALLDQEANTDDSLDAFVTPHADEHSADVVGSIFALGLGSDTQRSNVDIAISYAGVEFALQLYRSLEALGFPVSESHPRAQDRLDIIRSALRERCDDEATWQGLSGLAQSLEILFDRVQETILNPTEHAAFFDAQAEALIAELDEALDACSRQAIPDYFSFNQTARALFERGYSHRMLERISNVAAEYWQIGELPDLPIPEQITRFKKFKLLISFVNNSLAEPARSLFQAALAS